MVAHNAVNQALVATAIGSTSFLCCELLSEIIVCHVEQISSRFLWCFFPLIRIRHRVFQDFTPKQLWCECAGFHPTNRGWVSIYMS